VESACAGVQQVPVGACSAEGVVDLDLEHAAGEFGAAHGERGGAGARLEPGALAEDELADERARAADGAFVDDGVARVCAVAAWPEFAACAENKKLTRCRCRKAPRSLAGAVRAGLPVRFVA